MSQPQSLPATVRKDDMAGLARILDSGQFTQIDLDMALAHAVWYQSSGPHGFRKEMGDILIARGADPNGRYGDYGPIVFGTGECLNLGGLKYLISAGADVTFPPVDTKYGMQCSLSCWLGTYARGGNHVKHQGIDVLLQHHAFIPPEVSPAILAIHRGDAAGLARLLDADPSLISRRFDDMPYGNTSLRGATLLHCAVEFDETECIEVLFERHADINMRATPFDGIGDQTPLFHIINTGWNSQHQTLIHLVNRVGRRIDVSIKASFRRNDTPHAPVTALEYSLEPGDSKWRKNDDAERKILETLEHDGRIRNSVHGDDLFSAILAGDIDRVRSHLIDRGASVDAVNDKGNSALWFACQSPASAADRIAVARLLIGGGASVRRACENQSTALHVAAWRGPVAMVELLIRHGAKEWQTDKDGKTALDYAREGLAADKAEIMELLARPVIRDPAFKAAVRAIHEGDLDALRELLKNHPNLVHDRAIEPDCYSRADYFTDPKLLWFVANNPILMTTMSSNLVEIAEAIIDAGAEPADLDQTLGLVMTGNAARKQGLQIPLMKLLVDRGARPTDLLGVLGHRELEPVRFLLSRGLAMTPAIAGAMGLVDELARLLPSASGDDKQVALGLCVINRQLATASLCLEAGADPNQFLPVHKHSTAAHQAAINNDMPMLQLLLKHGARLDIRDTMWNGTPLGWARHAGGPESEMAKFLESRYPSPEN